MAWATGTRYWRYLYVLSIRKGDKLNPTQSYYYSKNLKSVVCLKFQQPYMLVDKVIIYPIIQSNIQSC